MGIYEDWGRGRECGVGFGIPNNRYRVYLIYMDISELMSMKTMMGTMGMIRALVPVELYLAGNPAPTDANIMKTII